MSKINTNKEQPDLLGDLFKRIPEEELPASFRSNVMRQIMLESAKAKKRDGTVQPVSGDRGLAYHDFPRDRIFRIYGDTQDSHPHDKHIGLGFLFIHRGHHAHTSIGGL